MHTHSHTHRRDKANYSIETIDAVTCMVTRRVSEAVPIIVLISHYCPVRSNSLDVTTSGLLFMFGTLMRTLRLLF